MFATCTVLIALWVNLIQYTQSEDSCGSVIIGDDCGFTGITALECRQRGCCYDFSARKINEKCLYPFDFFSSSNKDSKTFLGTSVLNIPEPTRALSDRLTKLSVEYELKNAFRYRFPQVRSVEVKNFTNAEFDYVITIFADKSFQMTAEDLLKAYANAMQIPESESSCGKYFIGLPIIRDYDECEASNVCDMKSVCVNTIGSYKCHCKDGFTKDQFGVCSDINECREMAEVCRQNQECTNTIGSYNCVCKDGFRIDSSDVCVDINECSQGKHNCSQETELCVNNVGGFECECKPGFRKYRFFGKKYCVEDDPCTSNPCHQDAECRRSGSSYTCQCREGFTGNGEQHCHEIKLCMLASVNNCHEKADCSNIPGSYLCTCQGGYTGDGFTCEDINECDNDLLCGNHAKCKNVEGSYQCTCDNGYRKLATDECLDIDECESNSCNTNAICRNLPGSYECSCNPGYVGDGITFCQETEDKIGRSITISLVGIHCDPVFGPKETETKLSKICSIDATCEAGTLGIYSCRCPKGLIGDPMEACYDWDECQEEFHECHAWSNCINTEGSYACDCATGFIGDGIDCKDANECEIGLHECSEHADCINTRGSYFCECKYGFIGNGYACEELFFYVALVRLTASYSYLVDLDCPGSIYFNEVSHDLMKDTFKLFRSTGDYVKDVIVTSFSKGSVLAEVIIATVGSSASDLNRVITYGVENGLTNMISGPALVIQTLNTSLESMDFVGESYTGILTKKHNSQTKVSKTFSGIIKLQPSMISRYEELYNDNLTNPDSDVRTEFDKKLSRELMWMHGYNNEYIEEVEINSIGTISQYLQLMKNRVEKPRVRFYKASVLMTYNVYDRRLYNDYQYASQYAIPKLLRSYGYALRREELTIGEERQVKDVQFNNDGYIQVSLTDVRGPNPGEVPDEFKVTKNTIIVEHLIVVSHEILMIDGILQKIDNEFLKKNLQLSSKEEKSILCVLDITQVSKSDGTIGFYRGLMQEWNIESVEDDNDILLAQYDVTIDGDSEILDLNELGLFNWFDKGVNDGNIVEDNKLSFSGLPKSLFMGSYTIGQPIHQEKNDKHSKESERKDKEYKEFKYSASIFLMDDVSPIPLLNVPTTHEVFETTAQVFEPQLFTAFTRGLKDLNSGDRNWEVKHIYIEIVAFRHPTTNESKKRTNVIADFHITVEVTGAITSNLLKDLLKRSFDHAATEDYFAEKLFVGAPWNFIEKIDHVTPTHKTTTGFTQTATQRVTTIKVTPRSLSAVRPTTQPSRITTRAWLSSTTESVTPQYDEESHDVTTAEANEVPLSTNTQEISELAYAISLILRAPRMSWFEIRSEVELLPPKARTLLIAMMHDPGSMQHIPNLTYFYLNAALEQTKHY
ncbi:uncharacterized protein LOC120341529 [Styela clava]